MSRTIRLEIDLPEAARRGDPDGIHTVSAILDRPVGEAPFALLVLAHGAGAGMEHDFMAAVAHALAERGVAVLRYNFPYMEAGGWPPDRARVATATVAAALERAAGLAEELRGGGGEGGGDGGGSPSLFAGGKSFGGRMTSTAFAEGVVTGKSAARVRGIVFLGFPLHPARKPGRERAEHLGRANHPMLFIQGTRDALASLELLEPVVEELGERARLHLVDGADHGFHVLKRSGRTDAEALEEVAEVAARWMREWSFHP